MTGIPQDSAPAREPRSAAPAAGPNPPLGAATTERPTTSPITPPGSTAAFKPGEIVQLTAAGIPAERWSSLPSAVIDLIRAQAVAVRNGRILVWTAWICVVLDLGVINLVGNKDPAGDPGGWLVLCQMIGGFMALVPGPWRAKRPPPEAAGRVRCPCGSHRGGAVPLRSVEHLRARAVAAWRLGAVACRSSHAVRDRRDRGKAAPADH